MSEGSQAPSVWRCRWEVHRLEGPFCLRPASDRGLQVLNIASSHLPLSPLSSFSAPFPHKLIPPEALFSVPLEGSVPGSSHSIWSVSLRAICHLW